MPFSTPRAVPATTRVRSDAYPVDGNELLEDAACWAIEHEGKLIGTPIFRFGLRAQDHALVLAQGCEDCEARGTMNDTVVTVRRIGDVIGWLIPVETRCGVPDPSSLEHALWMTVESYRALFATIPASARRDEMAPDPVAPLRAPFRDEISRLAEVERARYDRDTLDYVADGSQAAEARLRAVANGRSELDLLEILPTAPEPAHVLESWDRTLDDAVPMVIEAVDGTLWIPVGGGCWGRVRV